MSMLKSIRARIEAGEFKVANDEDIWNENESLRRNQLGLKFLGAGYYADVFALSSRHVLKILRREDEGYETFAVMAREFCKNPHLPRIYLEADWGHHKVYVLERLQRRTSGDNRGAKRILMNIAKGAKSTIKRATCPFLLQIAELFDREHGWMRADDLHKNNVMWRGNTPVITDPACG